MSFLKQLIVAAAVCLSIVFFWAREPTPPPTCLEKNFVIAKIGEEKLDIPAELSDSVSGYVRELRPNFNSNVPIEECRNTLVEIVPTWMVKFSLGKRQSEKYGAPLVTDTVDIFSQRNGKCLDGGTVVDLLALSDQASRSQGQIIAPGVIEYSNSHFSVVSQPEPNGGSVLTHGSCPPKGLEGGRHTIDTCKIYWHTKNGLCVRLHYNLTDNNRDGSEVARMPEVLSQLVDLVRVKFRCPGC